MASTSLGMSSASTSRRVVGPLIITVRAWACARNSIARSSLTSLSGVASSARDASSAAAKRSSRYTARKREIDGTKISTSASMTNAIVSRSSRPDRLLTMGG